MKLLQDNNQLSIYGTRFLFHDIHAKWEIGGTIYDILSEEATIEATGSRAAITSVFNGVKAVVTIEVFEKAARINMVVSSDREIEVASMIPFAAGVSGPADLNILKVPFDNDDWVTYQVCPWRDGGRSYGVGAAFSEDWAFSIGAVDFSDWKTGINFNGEVVVTAGVADQLTRDACKHGTLQGTQIHAPEVWLFEETGWQAAMEAFARQYAKQNDRLTWNRPAPKGWNSWYAYMAQIDGEKYGAAADFIAGLDHMEGAYINFDAFWNSLPEEKLRACAKKVSDAGMVPGIYMAPFAIWKKDGFDTPVTDDLGNILDETVTWQDVLLKDREGAVLPRVDEGLSLDVTHPVVLARIERTLSRLKALGYRYIKLDFLGHGAREGVFYDKTIRTGMQSYHFAMQKILGIWSGEDFFVSLSIAPLFPGGYGHARRVCCDVFGELKDSCYLLNALTYGYWMNKTVYEFNDPDHICVDKGDAEAKFRFLSGIIGGTVFLFSSKTEDEAACRQIREMTAKKEIMEIIPKHITFRPVEQYREKDLSCAFIGTDEASVYLALFNFGEEEKVFEFSETDHKKIMEAAEVKELYTGEMLKCQGFIRVSLPSKDCAILRI